MWTLLGVLVIAVTVYGIKIRIDSRARKGYEAGYKGLEIDSSLENNPNYIMGYLCGQGHRERGSGPIYRIEA